MPEMCEETRRAILAYEEKLTAAASRLVRGARMCVRDMISASDALRAAGPIKQCGFAQQEGPDREEHSRAPRHFPSPDCRRLGRATLGANVARAIDVGRYPIAHAEIAFTTVQRKIGSLAIEEVVTAPASPWQNAYVERVIGSLRGGSMLIDLPFALHYNDAFETASVQLIFSLNSAYCQLHVKPSRLSCAKYGVGNHSKGDA
jgi:hypothetical protein